MNPPLPGFAVEAMQGEGDALIRFFNEPEALWHLQVRRVEPFLATLARVPQLSLDVV